MIKQFSDIDYAYVQKKLLSTKGSDFQREFLQSLLDNASFLQWVRNNISVEQGSEIKLYSQKLSEAEYKNFSHVTEYSLYLLWKMLDPSITCKTTFWGEVTRRHVENESIQSSYLASPISSSLTGAENILNCLTNSHTKNIDDCVRTALRRLSGLPAARGNKSVYVNCPFARAWWRMHLCEEVVKNTSANRDAVLSVFHTNQQYWEEIITLVVSRSSALGDMKVRDVLVCLLSEIFTSDPDNKIFNASNLNHLCRVLGVRSAWQELGVLDITEIKSIIKSEIFRLYPTPP